MDEQTHATLMGALAMMDAYGRMMQDLLRHLVEEGHIEPHKAAKLVLDASAKAFPHDPTMGETYAAGRESLTVLATALLGWPGSDHAPRPPQKDLR